jgi:hypothetical protein
VVSRLRLFGSNTPLTADEARRMIFMLAYMRLVRFTGEGGRYMCSIVFSRASAGLTVAASSPGSSPLFPRSVMARSPARASPSRRGAPRAELWCATSAGL